MSTRYFLISAGCVSRTHDFAESRQGLAWHLDVTRPLREETKPPGLLHVVLLQAPSSLCHLTKIATVIRQCCVEVAAYQSDHGRFVLVIPSFHLPCLSILVSRPTGGNWGHALHPLFPKSPAGLFSSPLGGEGGVTVPGYRLTWLLPPALQ